MNCAASCGGSDLLSPQTFPRRMSFTETFFTLKPTLSPGRASLRASWCISTDFTSVVMFTGAKVTTMPGRRIPVSTRPTGTVPIPRETRTECSKIQSAWYIPGTEPGFNKGKISPVVVTKEHVSSLPKTPKISADQHQDLENHYEFCKKEATHSQKVLSNLHAPKVLLLEQLWHLLHGGLGHPCRCATTLSTSLMATPPAVTENEGGSVNDWDILQPVSPGDFGKIPLWRQVKHD